MPLSELNMARLDPRVYEPRYVYVREDDVFMKANDLAFVHGCAPTNYVVRTRYNKLEHLRVSATRCPSTSP